MQYFTYGNSNVDSLLTTTLSMWYKKSLTDNIFSKQVFLDTLYKSARKEDGGASILVPLLYETNSTATWYSGYDTIATTPQEGMTLGQAKWKNVADSITISNDELRKNSGKSQIISLVESKTMQAEMSLRNKVTTSLFASSTANTKTITAMTEMFDATSTIQDINSTSQSWWQANTAAVGSFALNGLSYMRSAYSTINNKQPGTPPDVIVTTDTVYNYYEGSLTNQLRYTSNDKADAGFMTLLFKSAKVMADAQCNSGYMYMYNSDDLKLVVNSNADFYKTEFVKPVNQDAKTAQIILMCEIVVANRRRLYKLTGIEA